ncbi:RNA polymerase sigma-70 factor [Echinicola soli]|uniref:RNA polymerase sigma-70 factor n=1 Tax=Echinicola soli TaxID=2591634 RepID=A0A514CJL4_9BACT|nr:RNA polymerase sigma-70 factor [Echinicola soli]QDH79844.1 RNA polymerase sigma-70 factor [Echinicola soli]
MNIVDIKKGRKEEQIFKKYYARLCAYAHSFLKDPQDAEDIVQDAFRVYLEKSSVVCDDQYAVKSFLYTAVKNACLNKFRNKKIQEEHKKYLKGNTITSPLGLENIIHAEVMGKLHEAINTLPHGCKMVIRLGYLEGLKNNQVAEVLNVSVNTVKTQKKRGLMLLKQKMGNQAILLLLLLGGQ